MLSLQSVFKDQGTRLIPDDPAGKGHVLQRLNEVIQPFHTLHLLRNN